MRFSSIYHGDSCTKPVCKKSDGSDVTTTDEMTRPAEHGTKKHVFAVIFRVYSVRGRPCVPRSRRFVRQKPSDGSSDEPDGCFPTNPLATTRLRRTQWRRRRERTEFTTKTNDNSRRWPPETCLVMYISSGYTRRARYWQSSRGPPARPPSHENANGGRDRSTTHTDIYPYGPAVLKLFLDPSDERVFRDRVNPYRFFSKSFLFL